MKSRVTVLMNDRASHKRTSDCLVTSAARRFSDSDSDSDKFIQQKYIQVPYQVYMSFVEIQITL